MFQELLNSKTKRITKRSLQFWHIEPEPTKSIKRQNLRDIGYEIIEHVPPTDIKEISATKIRQELREQGKL